MIDWNYATQRRAALRDAADPDDIRLELIEDALAFMDEYAEDLATLAKL